MTVAILAVLGFLSFVPIFQNTLLFSLASVAFFTLLSAGMYFLAAKAALSKDKNAFTRLIMLFTFGKLLLTTVLIVAYHRIAKPADNNFIIPFFLIYISYTIFETIFLSRLGKIQAR
ncbi:MAG: hypothetical protein AAB316_05985 [Bacteroidota bacterium]